MGDQATKKLVRIAVAIVFGALFGVSMGYAVRGLMNPTARLEALQEEPESETISPAEVIADAPVTVSNSVAMRYALALQNGEYERAIDMTRWMQERLAYVQQQTGSHEAVDAERESLIEQLSDRSIERNRFSEEGIDDQYIFAPGVQLEVLGVDTGEANLAEPVATRTWVRARFLSKQNAPRDGEDVPVRAVTVGVSVSEAGAILKANVIGNLEIDAESISYDWTTG